MPFILVTDSFRQFEKQNNRGSTNLFLNYNQIAEYEFALPPLEEQRRIAKLLCSFEDTKQLTQIAYERAWKTRISMYTHITQQGENNKQLMKSSIGMIPSHWTTMRVGDAVVIENNLRKPISAEVRAKMQGPYPYWGPTGKLDSINEYRLDGKFALIGEDGDHFLKNTIWSMTHLLNGKFNVNNHAHVISGSEHCSIEWFYHYFRHKDIRQWLTKQGSGRLKLKKADLIQMSIAVPPPFGQEHLIRILQNIVEGTDKLESRVEEVGTMLKTYLRTSLEVI